MLLRFLNGALNKGSRTIKIETSSFCNARCLWCGMQRFNKIKRGFMSFEQFKKIIDLNETFFKEHHYLIEPFFNGEALLNPQLFQMLDYMVERDIAFGPTFHTNLSVKVDIKRFLSYPWKQICVNIGGTDKATHEKVMENTDFGLVVSNLVEMLKIDRNRICIKMNPTKHNLDHIPRLKTFFEGLGGNPKNVLKYTTGFPTPAVFSNEEKRYFMENITCPEMNPHLRFTYEMNEEDFGIKAKTGGCKYMITSIAFDGRVTICCHDINGSFNMGNAFETPLKKILASKNFKKAQKIGRAQKYEICKECA